MQSVECGYCECGCGQQTKPWVQTESRSGAVKGQPHRFLHGHYARTSVPKIRFWAKVQIGEPGECWLWLGKKRTWSGGGRTYGGFSLNRRIIYAHRFSYELAYGPIPDGKMVCHSCDNPICVNPSHLWLGEHRDNMADMVAKGRGRSGGLRGSQCYNAKLADDDVRQIRGDIALGIPKAELARKYGVGEMEIGRIGRRERWKHIT